MVERLEQEPRRIISDSLNYEIINPRVGIRIFLDVGPNGTVSTKVERLTQREGQRLELETNFTDVVRQLINASLEEKAARLRSGSEDVAPELAKIAFRQQFEQTVGQMAGIGYSDKQIQRLILGQASQFTVGQTHIGEIPPIVKEEVGQLNSWVSYFYLQEAQTARGRVTRGRRR